jgi:hypothetical protein
MAAGLGFKTFTTGEVLTAADTNGYLMQGILVFASAAARDAAITSPQEGQCCYLKDTDAVQTYSGSAWVGFDDSNAIQNSIVDAKGDIVAASGNDTPARLAVGANGTMLTADSSAATGLKYLPFSVLQTKSVQSSTQQTTTSSTYADITSHTLTITPNSATNKILIVSTNSLLASGLAADGGIRILRDATNIFTSIQLIGSANIGGSFTSIYLDSPATTSAITYKAQWNRATGSGTVYSNVAGTLSNLIVMEIYA